MSAGRSDKGLPPYQLRISARAKYIRLRMLPTGALELVLPRRVELAEGEAFLQSRADWIERSRRRLAVQQADYREACHEAPRRIHLQAIGEEWRVEFASAPSRRAVLTEEGGGCLRIAGGEDDVAICRRLLREWLKRRARAVLPGWLEEIGQRTGLRCQRVGVRLQKSRWGSCSSRLSINLNAKLLFLPPEQVEYVLLHELCHTRELNHSPAFWTLVQRHMAQGRELDRELRHANRHVPLWIHCD